MCNCSGSLISPCMSNAESQVLHWEKVKVRANKQTKSIFTLGTSSFSEQSSDSHLLRPGFTCQRGFEGLFSGSFQRKHHKAIQTTGMCVCVCTCIYVQELLFFSPFSCLPPPVTLLFLLCPLRYSIVSLHFTWFSVSACFLFSSFSPLPTLSVHFYQVTSSSFLLCVILFFSPLHIVFYLYCCLHRMGGASCNTICTKCCPTSNASTSGFPRTEAGAHLGSPLFTVQEPSCPM